MQRTLKQIIPPKNNPEVKKLNSAIAQVGQKKNTQQSPVIVVDQYSGFDATEDNYDGLHPNQRGEKKMAGRWFGALKPILARKHILAGKKCSYLRKH